MSKLITALFLLFTNLILQILFKYSIYDIPLSDINFSYLGNIFNLLLSFLIILGAVLLHVVGNGYDNKVFRTIIFVSILAIVSYGIGYAISTFEFEPLNTYLFEVPARKFYLAVIFIINLFTHYYLLAYIWGILIGRQSSGSVRAFSGAILAITLTLGFSYYFITSQSYKLKQIQSAQSYDIAVVLGAAVWSNNKPSTIFEGRIKKVHKLSQVGKVRTVQFTGGNAPGEISEAKAGADYYKDLGSSSSRVLIEEETSTTIQQVEFTRNNFFRNTQPLKVVLISDDFHLPRAIEMAHFFNIKVEGIASDYNLNLEKLLYYRFRESIALVLFWLFGI
ncbi:MAG: YdcF family protein [Melioribacteraceae bacterium]|nr:YdcF family protein [Melioribacteraceae bacterium]WKZ68312.1 MAG: YdcF family protein [Melioribacteraceae bacterium]